jgi:hypothetical protein
VNISRVAAGAAGPAEQSVARLQYSAPLRYVGDHDQFLQLAKAANNIFITNVKRGNFTSVLQRLAVAAGESLLYNATSPSARLLGFDHEYNSPAPSLLPTRSAEAELFYEKAWFTLTLSIVVVCAAVVAVFAAGFYWRAGVRHVNGQVRKVFVRPKIEADSSSDSESDTEQVGGCLHRAEVEVDCVSVIYVGWWRWLFSH